MKVVLVFGVFAVICGSFLLNSVSARTPDMNCKEFLGLVTKKQMGGIGACSKSMKFKNPKEKAAKTNCILKCLMTREKMLNADGVFDDETFEAFLNELIPVNLMDTIAPKWKNCRAVAGPLDPNEEYCKSYDPLIKCVLDMIGSMCK